MLKRILDQEYDVLPELLHRKKKKERYNLSSTLKVLFYHRNQNLRE